MAREVLRPTSDELFRRVLHAASEGMLIHRDGILLEVNEAFARIYGFADTEEAVATPLLDLVAPEARARVAAGIFDPSDDTDEYECVKRDGTRILIRARGANIIADGLPARVVTVTDITEELRTADRLYQANELFRLAFNGSPIGKALVSPDGRLLHVNPAMCRLLGYRADELVTKTFHDITHPDDLERDVNLANQVLVGKIPDYSLEKRYFHADGHVIWAKLSVALMRYPDGTPRYFISQIEDVSDRKRIEEAWLHETATVKLLQLVAVAANTTEDPADAYGTALEAICAHTGWPVGHVYLHSADGRTLEPSGIWHIDDPERYGAFRSATDAITLTPGFGLPGRVFDTGRPTWIGDFVARCLPRSAAAGQSGLRAALALPVLVGNDVVAVLEFLSPVTTPPHDTLMEVLANIGTQLGRVVERSRLREQQAELDAARARFVANAAHELRTPLATLRTVASLLGSRRDEMSPDEIAECCNLLERQGSNLDSLVDDLLDLTRIEHGDTGRLTELVPVDLWVSRALETALTPEGVEVTVDVAPDLIVVGDPDRLHRALVNLITNAYRHGGPAVAVIAHTDGDTVVLSVEDDGDGVPEHLVPQVFEPFARITDATGGAGLGLAIARTVVEQLRGTIAYEPTGAGGARFVVRLPVAS